MSVTDGEEGSQVISSGGDSSSLQPALELLSSIVAPVTALTALLYYFGWVRSGALFGYFGVDQAVLGFSTQDYLLRSAGVAFRPALVLLAVVAAGIGGRAMLAQAAQRSWTPTVRRVTTWAGRGAVLMLVIVCALSLGGHAPPLLGAIALGLTSLMLASATRNRPGARKPPRSLSRALVGVTASGVMLSLFWATAFYAEHSGRDLAEFIGSNPRSRPAAVVYSAKRLQIEGPGVHVDSLPPDATAAYQYRYSGLRLLIYAGQRWFLIPEGWSRTNGASLIPLRDDGTVRVDLTTFTDAPRQPSTNVASARWPDFGQRRGPGLTRHRATARWRPSRSQYPDAPSVLTSAHVALARDARLCRTAGGTRDHAAARAVPTALSLGAVASSRPTGPGLSKRAVHDEAWCCCRRRRVELDVAEAPVELDGVLPCHQDVEHQVVKPVLDRVLVQAMHECPAYAAAMGRADVEALDLRRRGSRTSECDTPDRRAGAVGEQDRSGKGVCGARVVVLQTEGRG